MKVTKLTIKNIGKITEMVIDLNKPLILFYGEIMQGKTTILNAVKWCFGGAFPSDIIKHGEKEGSVTLDIDGGCVSRSWYINKAGTTESRSISFVKNGKPVSSPVAEIKRFLNPFLLDQDHLKNMTEPERKVFFTELFAVDTTQLDTEAFNCERDARELRSKVKGYGEIDLTKVEPVDVSSLKTQLASIREAHQAIVDAVESDNKAIREFNATVARGSARLESLTAEIDEIEKKLQTLKQDHKKVSDWMTANPPKSEKQKPDAINTSELEAKIQDAGAVNVRAESYQSNLKRSELKKKDEERISELEKRQRAIKIEKTAKLKTVSDSCGIKDLSFDDSGNLNYQGTQAGMLSTSQIMRLSSELSQLYPEGFGLDLIDRGECLGKSIFSFVERAKEEKKTILATIVGEKPANVPEEIGVFVVEDGKLK